MAFDAINSPPIKVGYFSVTSDRQYDATASALRYYKEPTGFPIDLKELEIEEEEFFDERLDKILQHIVLNKSDFMRANNDVLIPSTKYITYRGLLNRIMIRAIDKRHTQNLCVLATKFKNNIYLCLKNSILKNTGDLLQKQFMLYGSKLKQLCLTHDPSVLPNSSQQIDTQFSCVFQRKLVNRDFLFTAKMDGILSAEKVDVNRDILNDLIFIELKIGNDTTVSQQSLQKFRQYKTCAVWNQMFLSGVNDIYFGIRDLNGILKEIKHYTIDGMKRQGSRYWSPDECFRYLDKFLNIVEKRMANINCPHTVFEFNFGREIECKEHRGLNDLSFLPESYLKEAQEMMG